jgi:ubiquinone/menaquinone biosynthesis C-methylase UbiE
MTSKPLSAPQRTTAEVSWQRAAGGMDTTLPATSPVTEAVIGHITGPAAGSLLLDLACGTGQPAFALAAAHPAAEVLGIDVTPAMVEQAGAKAAGNAVADARFEVMSVDRLALPDASIDAAVSQFGLLQEGDVSASVHELARVLAPGAYFSIAAFDDMALNTFVPLVRAVPVG